MNAQDLGLKEGEELVVDGLYSEQMTELRRLGYTPWSTEDAMDARNEVPTEHPLWKCILDTDMGLFGSRDAVYLKHHSPTLRAVTPVYLNPISPTLPVVTPYTKLWRCGISVKGLSTAKVYNRSDLILGKYLTEEEALTHPLWLGFAGGDQKRLEKYVERTFRFGKDKFKYNYMMGIYIDSDFVERPAVLDLLGHRARGGDSPIDEWILYRFVDDYPFSDGASPPEYGWRARALVGRKRP